MLVNTSSQEYLTAANLRDSIAAMHLAEAGIQRALYELNYNGANSVVLESISLGRGAYSVRLMSEEGKPMLIANGFVPSKKWRIKRTIQAELNGTADGYVVSKIRCY